MKHVDMLAMLAEEEDFKNQKNLVTRTA